MKKFYFLVFLFVGFSAFAQTYQYHFNNNLNEQGGGPALVDTLTCGASVAGYSNQAVCTGGTKNVLNFNGGEGLVFRNDPSFLSSSSSYTINILMKYNSLNGTGNASGAQRIINFDTSANDGIYSFAPTGSIPNGVVDFYTGQSLVANNKKEITAGNFFLYTIVKDAVADSFFTYINGVKSDSISGPNSFGILAPKSSTAPIWFFLDNGTTGGIYTCEDGPGSISYLSISNSAFTATQVDSTSQAQCPIILPLRLLDFHANKQAGSVQLSWTTSSEINTSYFELQRGSDGINFNKLATIPTHNNISVNNYSFVDQQPLPTNYYRLKMVDIDGKFTYSGILKINFTGTQKL